MSNIYEALKQSSRERAKPGVTPQIAMPAHTTRALALDDEMASLHQQVETMLPESSNKLIQFISSRRGEGVSTIVRQFAKTAVERYGKSVLVLDSAYQDPARKINFNVTCEFGWLDLLEKGELDEKALFRFGDTNLFFAPISFKASLVTPLKGLSATAELWTKLKERFDLILIDSSSDANSAESIAVSRNVDGVVVVIEADKTPRRVVRNLVRRISDNGGIVIGAVLNRRRYHIPRFLYHKL